ncbi:MAG TPA: hypothetical protein VK480_11045 [Solirubrobacterales bacterium]|nr:hypothetical protein [Solirubrobacterales bacterium]
MNAPTPTSTPPPGARPLWGSHKGTEAVSASSLSPDAGHSRTDAAAELLFGEGPLEPLSRRLLQTVGVLAVLLVLVLVNASLHRAEGPLDTSAAVSALGQLLAAVPLL